MRRQRGPGTHGRGCVQLQFNATEDDGSCGPETFGFSIFCSSQAQAGGQQVQTNGTVPSDLGWSVTCSAELPESTVVWEDSNPNRCRLVGGSMVRGN